MTREPVDWERTFAERAPTDPHTFTPAVPTGWGFWQRECSCGWNLGSPTREQIMAASKRHRAWVGYYRRLAKKETP